MSKKPAPTNGAKAAILLRQMKSIPRGKDCAHTVKLSDDDVGEITKALAARAKEPAR